MLWDIQKEIFCQQLAQISLQRANNCLYSGRFWFKMPKKHKTSQKVAECKVENLLLSNITSTEVYVQYGCNKFQAQLRLRFHTISPTVLYSRLQSIVIPLMLSACVTYRRSKQVVLRDHQIISWPHLLTIPLYREFAFKFVPERTTIEGKNFKNH